MKALQLDKPRNFVQVQTDIPNLQDFGPNRILVQPEWISICGSDIPFFTGNKRHRSYPMPVGFPTHECVGLVVESTSDLFQPGDRVVAIPEGDRGLADFFVAQAAKAIRLPADLRDTGASCIIQPLSTVVNAVDRLGEVQGKSIAVIGLGSIGLLFCWYLKQRGVTRILGIDPVEHRCKVAEEMGASEVITAKSIDFLQNVRSSPTTRYEPDICIEAVGHQMETLNDCLSLVKQRGTILAFGVPDQLVYALEFETFFRKNAVLMACVTPTWSEYLEKSRDIYLAARSQLEALVTHRFPIRDAEKAFSLYESHYDGILKVSIDMSEW